MKSANQFVKLVFLLILIARIHSARTKGFKSEADKSSTKPNKEDITTRTPKPKVPLPTTGFFSDGRNIVGCSTGGGLFVLLLLLLFFILVKKYRRKAQAITATVELRRVSAVSFKPNILSDSIAIPITSPTSPTSPVYCEADIFQFPSGSESRSETANTEVEASTDSDDEYSYPDANATMNGQDPLQASGVYSYAYDHITVNTDYVNVSPRVRSTNDTKDDLEYEYVQKSRNSTEHEEDDYGYAYDHRSTFTACFVGARTPSASAQEYTYKDDADGGDIYENFPAVLSLENKTDPLEYINVL